MKLWTTLAVAGLMTGSALATDTTTTQGMGGGKWKINVGLALPSGDHSDAGVDTMFMVGADWMLAAMSGYSNLEQFVGIGGMFGEGDGDLKSTSYGVHYGVLFNLDQMNQGAGSFKIKLQGGYYNTKLEAGSADGSFEEDKWGFGGLIGIMFKPNMSNGFTFEGGFYFMPEVDGVDNRGWYVGLGIPVK